jgi:Bacterial Ig-like domain (group 3)
MDLLGSLNTLITQAKNITLPGVVAALAFAIIAWPPKPFDRIPTVIDNHPDIAQLELKTRQLQEDGDPANLNGSLGDYLLKQGTPACTVLEGADSYSFLIIPGVRDRAAIAVKNQLVLDDMNRTLSKCIEEEQALQGIEDQIITNTNALIATRITERDGINTNYQKYVNSLADLTGHFEQLRNAKEMEIAMLQARSLNFQRVQKERVRRVSELTRLQGEIGQRLADAGRLRPSQKFDDVLSALSAHIIGFLSLVLAWGLLIDPVNRTIFSFFYDNQFDDAWDAVRPARKTPGQNAYNKWWGKQPQQLTSIPVVSLVVVLLFLVAGWAVVYLWEPASSVRQPTMTLLCPARPNAVAGDDLTVMATVIAPGSLEVPAGKVTFWDGSNSYTALLKDNGSADFTIPNLPAGTHFLRADYMQSDGTKSVLKFQPSSSLQVIERVSCLVDEKTNCYKPKSKCGCNCCESGTRSSDKTVDADSGYEESKAPASAPRCNSNAKPECTDCEHNCGNRDHVAKTLMSPPIPACIPRVPELAKPSLPPFWPLFWKCFVVTAMAFLIALFSPGLLRLIPAQEPEEPKPTKEAQRAFEASASDLGHYPQSRDLAREFVEELDEALKTEPKKEGLADRSTGGDSGLQAKFATILAGHMEYLRKDSSGSATKNQKVPNLLESKLQNLRSKFWEPSSQFQDEVAAGPTDEENESANALVSELITNLKEEQARSSRQESEGEKVEDPQKTLNELAGKLAKALAKNLPHRGKKSLTCEQQLAAKWPKLSQPQYAMGQGLLARSDFQNLQDSYYSQSLVSTGLLFPLFFFLLALLLSPQFRLNGEWVYVVLGIGEILLLITGVDRRHKYYAELDATISSAFLKMCTQNAKSSSDDEKSVAKQINEALTAARIVENTDLRILPGDPPVKATPTQTSASGSTSDPKKKKNDVSSGGGT